MDFTELVGLDFETYGALSLPEVGLARYVNDKTFMPTLASVATKSGTVTLEFPAEQPGLLRELLTNGGAVCAHNAGFERAVLGTMGIDIPVLDSAVVAAVAGADRHLAGAAQQLMTPGKLDEDRSLMNLFAMRQKDQISPEFDRDLITLHPDKWVAYKEYCERDAELSRGIIIDWHGEPALFAREMRYAQITLDMNEAGWPVDLASVEEMRNRYLVNLSQLQNDFANDFDPDLNLASHTQVKKWCADRGVTSSSFDKQHVEKLHARLAKLQQKAPLTQGQAEVLALLETKAALGGSSLKKLETILATAFEGRVYDQYVHAGAPQSLRTSGRSIQMQNLPRLPAELGDMAALHQVLPVYGGRIQWSNEELGSNIRQLFCSSDPDGQLIVGDFASIESRGLGYLAGETWKVEAYRAGQDVYKAQACLIYKINGIDNVTKEQRTTGKVGELSCGYGAGGVAVKDFAAKMHVDLTEGGAAKLVRDWRDANPQTVKFWEALGDALYQAVEHKTPTYVQAAHAVVIGFMPSTTPASLFAQVPNVTSIEMIMWKNGVRFMTRVFHGCYVRGRNIGFYKPSSLKGGKAWKDRYVDPKTKRLKFYELYGGKLAGILTQSLCREIFFESLDLISLALEEIPNATIVGQFHDEVIVDWVPGPVPKVRVLDILTSAMSSSATHPELPMAVEVKQDYRYTK